MKKVFVVLCAVAIGFAFTSCTKDCVCTGEYGVKDVLVIPVNETFTGVKSADCKDDYWKLPADYEKPECFVMTVKCEAK
jgi:hypothetical protein